MFFFFFKFLSILFFYSQTAEEVFAVLGRDPIIELAMELERIALSDEYFIKRKLYPNVDFYSGIIYKAMGFPTGKNLLFIFKYVLT